MDHETQYRTLKSKQNGPYSNTGMNIGAPAMWENRRKHHNQQIRCSGRV